MSASYIHDLILIDELKQKLATAIAERDRLQSCFKYWADERVAHTKLREANCQLLLAIAPTDENLQSFWPAVRNAGVASLNLSALRAVFLEVAARAGLKVVLTFESKDEKVKP